MVDIKFLIIIIALIEFLLARLIYLRGKKKLTNIIFALLNITSGLWALSLYFYEHPILFSSLIWIKITYFFALFLTFFAFYFSLIFPVKVKNTSKLLKLYIFLMIPFLYLLFFTNLWVKDVVIHEKEVQTVLGQFYILFIIYSGIFFSWAIFNFTKNYLSLLGIDKTRLRYILWGIFLSGMGIFIPDGIIPLVNGVTSYFWLSPVLNIFFVGSTTYAISRYRLMDIRFVIGKGTVYLFSFVSVIGLALLLLFLNNQLVRSIPINIAASLILIIGILLFQPIFRFFEKWASKYFYYTFYSYQTVLTDLGKGLTRFLDLEQLSSLIVNTLMDTMKLDRTMVLLREPGDGEYKIQKNIGFKEENGISLVKDNFLTIYLERTQKPLVYEEISLIIRDTTEKEERERLERLQGNMKRIEAALCLPLFIEEKIVGMIVLGNKLSGEPYSTQDIELLTNLANQTSIALQNAKLYSEVKGFSKKLEREVEKATTELREAYEELKKLDVSKSEFISIASHQLRTPLTAIKGYISMILEKTYGNLPKNIEKPIKNIYLSNERLIKLVNNLLNISRIESGKIEINLEEISVEELIESVIEELKNETKDRGLYLKFEKPKSPVPKIMVDKEKLRQVIMNLIDNAIKYTEEGGVTIKLEIENSKLKIIISDTGVGMEKEELEKMFESFSRGSAGTRLYTEGAGLGLYVAKKFIELQNGKIWAESAGKGKGSTFYIELPVNQLRNKNN